MRISQQSWQWFLTLTLAGDGSPTRENFKRLAKGWSGVRHWLKRTHRLSAYTWVRERGHKGSRRVHLHVLLTCDRISARSLRRIAVNNGLGTWLHLSPIKSESQAKRYVSKYLGKDAGTHVFPRYVRRVQSTVKRLPAAPGWHFLKRDRPRKRTWFSDHCPGADLLSLTRLEKLELQDEGKSDFQDDVVSDSAMQRWFALAGLAAPGA